MLPSMAGGDFVIASRLFFHLKVGNIVIVDHPDFHKIIKRIEKISPSGQLWLTGDNHSDSVSSKQMGWVDRKNVKAKVLFIIRP